MNQHAAAPTVLYRLAQVLLALLRVAYRVQEPHVMPPGNLCNNLLHKLFVRVGLGKSAHVLEVARRESLQLGERVKKVRSQPVYHLRAQAEPLLPRQYVTTDIPVEGDQSRLTASAALTCASRIRSFRSLRNSSYPSATWDRLSVTTHSHVACMGDCAS